MSRRLRILLALTIVFINMRSFGDVCGLYSYQDMWIDEGGNAVGYNLSQANCIESTTFAEVNLTMPSGAHGGASATASPSAEAVVILSGADEEGVGDLSGYSEAWSSCFDGSSFIGFDVEIRIGPAAVTKSVWIGGQMAGSCAVTSACLNGVPMCVTTHVNVGEGGTCSPAWYSFYLTYKLGLSPWHCVTTGAAVPTNNTNPEYCTPPMP